MRERVKDRVITLNQKAEADVLALKEFLTKYIDTQIQHHLNNQKLEFKQKMDDMENKFKITIEKRHRETLSTCYKEIESKANKIVKD